MLQQIGWRASRKTNGAYLALGIDGLAHQGALDAEFWGDRWASAQHDARRPAAAA